MSTIARWAALAAALIAVAVAVTETARGVDPALREPKVAGVLAALRRAPLPVHATVLLVLPRGLSADQDRAVLFEAAWQRPDLRWALPADWPRGAVPDAAVTVGAGAVPAGWRPAWQEGPIGVWERGP